MGKEGRWGRNPAPQSPHLFSAGNESTGGMKCGGCVNLGVVSNESRSRSEDFLPLSGAVSVLQSDVRFESLPLQPAPAVQ